MKFQDRLKKDSRADLWREYCGFLDLSIDDYMYIQNRLMEEQIRKWSASGPRHPLVLPPLWLPDPRSRVPPGPGFSVLPAEHPSGMGGGPMDLPQTVFRLRRVQAAHPLPDPDPEEPSGMDPSCGRKALRKELTP